MLEVEAYRAWNTALANDAAFLPEIFQFDPEQMVRSTDDPALTRGARARQCAGTP